MFLKKMTKREQANAHKAAVPAFVFYLLALGGMRCTCISRVINHPSLLSFSWRVSLFFSPQIGYIIKSVHKKSPHHEGFFLTSDFYIGLLNFYGCTE